MESNLRTRVLVRALRELREQARLTQQEAGDRLRFDNRKMSRIERGQLPSYHELHAMLDVYGVPVDKWAMYDSLWEQAKKKGWWHEYGLSGRGYVQLESEATSLKAFQVGLVPGLLQTRAYAQTIFDQAPMPGGKVDRAWEIRLRRQQRLTAEPPLHLHAVIDYSVLARRMPCMRDQLGHLVMLSELENVTIQVIPDDVPMHVGLAGSFVILEFADAEVAYIEHVAGSLQMERANELRACRVSFERLTSVALSQEDSVALIDRMAADL